ncbi:DBH-like monooxygenase protein 1 homolog [Argopecten irradians]|uniref:DBH-like monooxygenase protein 1 homolog n=1 Tax=Argopecten irradians TaxID=31199 RepID=UPI003714B25B
MFTVFIFLCVSFCLAGCEVTDTTEAAAVSHVAAVDKVTTTSDAASTTGRPFQLQKPMPTRKFAHESNLDKDGAYWLFWEANQTHVTFETHVKTRGYVGFGISGNGQMFPGDVVVGWVKDGVTHFKDCHTTAHAMPQEDDSQDWVLLHGEENDFGTVLRFTRKLDTCDDDDFKITDDTIRVIFSYHPDDPAHVTSLPWHGLARRGSRALLLLSATSASAITVPSDVQTFGFLKSNYHVPAAGTTYHCSTYRLPDLPTKHHMFKYEPYVQKGNEKHVHHIVLYFYNREIDPQYDNLNFDCTMGKNTPDALTGLRSIFLVWAVGGGTYYLPEHTGIPLGDHGDPKFFVMETHYDNPTHKTDIVDSSGIIISYTSQLRQHDAGMIYAGADVYPTQIIPPYEKAFVTKSYCPEECFQSALPETGVNVFAVFQHAHLLGTAIKTRHFRNGTELEPFADDKHYDFDFQDIRARTHEIHLQKGDSVAVDCTYDSRLKTKPTYGGISTQEEMCISMLLFYPPMKMNGCTSKPLYENVSTSLMDAVKAIGAWDWTQPSVRRRFKSIVDNTNHQMHCHAGGMKVQRITRKIVPPTQTYQEPRGNCPT